MSLPKNSTANGPFEKMYDKLTDGMTSLYDNAKTEHKKGMTFSYANSITIRFGNNQTIASMPHLLSPSE